MDPLVGGLIAAAAAWLSILVVLWLPAGPRRIDPRVIRGVGATTIAMFGLHALGLPVPLWLPLLVFLGGLMIAVVIAPKGFAAAA